MEMDSYRVMTWSIDGWAVSKVNIDAAATWCKDDGILRLRQSGPQAVVKGCSLEKTDPSSFVEVSDFYEVIARLQAVLRKNNYWRKCAPRLETEAICN